MQWLGVLVWERLYRNPWQASTNLPMGQKCLKILKICPFDRLYGSVSHTKCVPIELIYYYEGLICNSYPYIFLHERILKKYLNDL